MQKFSQQVKVEDELIGSRLDQAAASLFPDFSRSRLQQWIKEGKLLVNGCQGQVRQKLFGGETLSLAATVEGSEQWQAEKIALEILFEDASLLVINKPAGLVVHPAAGNYSGTLLNALLYHEPGLAEIPRAGIVHRLDKDTSGLMVVAKTLQTHQALVDAIQAREVKRAYQALVNGVVTAGDTVDAPLGRHPVNRKKRAVVSGRNGKAAVSHYSIMQRFRAHTLLEVRLETGRTHQIRVHMAHIGFPLVGDPVYGGRLKIPKASSPALIEALTAFRRQALHAWNLGLQHPQSGEYLEWQVAMPADMQALLNILDEDNA